LWPSLVRLFIAAFMAYIPVTRLGAFMAGMARFREGKMPGRREPMTSNTMPILQVKTWNTLQGRIEQLQQEKVRLLDEWGLAMKRAYGAPPPDRHDAIQTVGKKYSDLIDALEAHINRRFLVC
jgi:hypothetical protein